MKEESQDCTVKEEEADNVHHKTNDSNPKDENRIVQLLRIDEPLTGLNENGKAKGQEKDGIDQGTQHLGPSPAKSVL